MKLYKYCDCNGVNILRHKVLKMSRIDEFNDPFEFKMAKCESEIISNGLKAVYEYQKKNYRVICFSANANNLILWSHYSKNHTGILVELETDLIILDGGSITESLESVKYKDEMISIPGNFLELTESEQENIIKLNTFRKFSDWKYENEYRAIIKVGKIEESKGYIEFPSAAILDVIIGMNCNLETELMVRDLLNREEFKHTSFRKAIPDEKKYQMRYFNIPR